MNRLTFIQNKTQGWSFISKNASNTNNKYSN